MKAGFGYLIHVSVILSDKLHGVTHHASLPLAS